MNLHSVWECRIVNQDSPPDDTPPLPLVYSSPGPSPSEPPQHTHEPSNHIQPDTLTSSPRRDKNQISVIFRIKLLALIL